MERIARANRAWSLWLGAAILAAGLGSAEEPVPAVPVPVPAPLRAGNRPTQLLDRREVGLTGRRMVANRGRAPVLPSGAFMAEGEVALGSLNAGKPGEAAGVLGLRDLEVQAEIEGLCARTTVKHVFANGTDDLLEGVFTFALPPGVAVDRFAMTIVGESDLMEASLVERNRARNIYSELVYGRGIDPGLLEWVDTSTFRATIFPIPAKGTKTIVVSYLQPLPQAIASDGRRVVQYCYPLLSRGTGRSALSPASNTKLSAWVLNVPKGAELSSSLEAHEVADAAGNRMLCVDLPPGREPNAHWFVTLEAPTGHSAEDLECFVQAYRPDAEKDGVFAVTVTPVLSGYAPPPALDVLFMVDISASRTGAEYAGALELVEAALKALRPADRFAVMTFDIQARTLDQGWMRNEPENIERAIQLLRRSPPLGATDLGAAFQAARHEFAGKAQNPARVVFVGDVQATFGQRNADELKKIARGLLNDMHAEMLCVWPGEGQPPSERGVFAGLKALAELSGSPVLKLTSDVRPAALGEGLGRNAGLPILRRAELKVTLPDGRTIGDLAPGVLGGLAANASSTFYGRYGMGGNAAVILRGEMDGKPYEKRWTVRLPDLERANAAVGKLHARARIEQLEGEGSAAEANRLAAESQVLSHGTAFLVLDSEEMFRRYGIERDMQDAIRTYALTSRFVGGRSSAAVRHAPEGSGGPGREIRIFNGTVQVARAPVEIEGVYVKVDNLNVEVPARQPGRSAPLTPGECLERRQGLTRLIAVQRGLPFEPEVVLPQLWLEALPLTKSAGREKVEDRFGPAADEPVWSKVEGQPTEGDSAWQAHSATAHGFGMGAGHGESPADPKFLLDLLAKPRKPSAIHASPDGKLLQVESHQVAHQLLGAMLYGRDPQCWNAGGDSETRRAVCTSRLVRYDLRNVPQPRLAAAWNLLAEVALAEGQHKAAIELAGRALKLAPQGSADMPSEARRTCMLLGLAQQLAGRHKDAAASYKRMLSGAKPLARAGHDLTYYALVASMLHAGDVEGATAVMERWFATAENKDELAGQIGRMYLALKRPADAIRAFSSKAEFDPAKGEKVKTPEEFLTQE